MREFSVSPTSFSFHVKVFHAVPSSRATPSRTVHFPELRKAAAANIAELLLSGLLLTYFDFSHSVLKRSSIGLNTAQKRSSEISAQLHKPARERKVCCVWENFLQSPIEKKSQESKERSLVLNHFFIKLKKEKRRNQICVIFRHTVISL